MKIINWVKSNVLTFALIALGIWAIFQVWNPVTKLGKQIRAGVEWLLCGIAAIACLVFLFSGGLFGIGALGLFAIAVFFGHEASADTGYANAANPPADLSASTDGSSSGG